MRLNLKWFRLSSAVMITAALLVGCAKDELVTPATDLQLDERGLTVGSVNPPLVGLTNANQLVHLMSGPPVVEQAVIAITGLRDGENVIAIDTRPATGELFGVTNQNLIYRIDKNTGTAIAVSGVALDPAIVGDFVGADFNPQDDQLRIWTNTGQILKVSPLTGAVTGTESIFSLGNATRINSVAYMPMIPGSLARPTLYILDISTNSLYRQGSFGSLQLVGATGYNWYNEGGFDITSTYYAFAVQYGESRTGGTIGTEDTSQPASRLFKIDLRSGRATSQGKVRDLIGITTR
jgi:hypothetical protein